MSLAYRISQRNRERKWQLFIREFPPVPTQRILDVGFSDIEYSPTDNLIEKKYPYRNMIQVLGIEEPVAFRKKYPDVPVQVYDGKIFPFADQSFDVVWSNAVIEHVGAQDRQVLFLKEIARTGKAAFITTPNRWFPFEVHTRVPFLHWFLPKHWFDGFLRLIGKDWATGDYMNLLSARDIKACLAKAQVQNYRLIRNRLWGFTLDFVVIIESKV